MNRVTVPIEVDLPEGVEFREYLRWEDGHAFLVDWALPLRCRCQQCDHQEPARIRFENDFLAIRDLDVWGQPSFFVYQPAFHACSRCGHRQQVRAPFKRKDMMYTYRFEELVLRSLIGSTEEEVAERLGIAAETVARIVRNQLAQSGAQRADPQRVVTDIGLDEISLKKRHKLYATVLTDLTDPADPQVLAVAAGKDEAAARKCLEMLTLEQRQAVRTHRTDMGPSFLAACATGLPNSQSVIDRFHVAKKLGEVSDRLRKKNHSGVQADAVEGPTPGVSLADVGISPPLAGSEAGGARGSGVVI
jgi:transposase